MCNDILMSVGPAQSGDRWGTGEPSDVDEGKMCVLLILL